MDGITSPKRKRLADAVSPRLAKKACPKDGDLPIPSTPELVHQAISPFLAKHVPATYAPLGGSPGGPAEAGGTSNTKYCYRHRPDIKCRGQADEPSMDQLQHALEELSPNDQQGIAHVWALFSAAPAKHRNLMLQGILSQCCFPQLSYLADRLNDLVRIDFLSALPTELAFKILCYLDTTSLCKATQVSGRWRQLADDDVIWHRMCEQHIDRKCTKCGWGLPLLERKRLRATKREIQLRASGHGSNAWSPHPSPGLETASRRASEDSERSGGDVGRATSTSPALLDPTAGRKFRPWKEVYKDRFKVGSNWKHKRYSTRIFRGHTNGVMCVQFDEQFLITGSYDATLKVWNLETGALLRTLHGHTSGIRSLQFDATKLISGSLDNTIKVWNWHSGECLRTLSGHAGGVISVHFASTYLVSGSTDTTMRLWNFEDKSTSVFRGHGDWVNAVRLDIPSRTIFSASDDFTIRLWDLDTKATLRTFAGHVGQVQQVVPLPLEFETSDSLDDPHASDASDSAPSPAPAPGVATPSAATASLAFDTSHGRASPPRYMLTSALDSTIRLWDVASGQSIRTFFGHVEGVWALAADTLRFVSGSEDRTVKVWDPRSGGCEATFTGHTAPVTCIWLSECGMATGGEDGETRLYSFGGWTKEGATCETD